ncbi:hypothetical protein ES703_48513 [subsurface metagenome]
MRVHLVVAAAGVPPASRETGWTSRLSNDIVEKNICLGIHICGFPAGPDGYRPQRRGRGDRNRTCIDYTAWVPPKISNIIWLSAVERIIYHGIFGFGGDCNRERRIVKTTLMAEFRVVNLA